MTVKNTQWWNTQLGAAYGKEASMPETPTPQTMPLAITADLTTIKVILSELIAAIEQGPRTRCRALATTHMQEARHWIQDAQAEEYTT